MRNCIMLIIGVLLLASCSSVKVTTDYDKTVDFTRHKAAEFYGWAENSDKILNQFEKERIENAFNEEFKKRGIKIVGKGQGDVIISLFIVTVEKTQRTATTTSLGGGYYGYAEYYDYGPGYGWGAGHSTTTFNDYEYTVGTLAVSVFDAKKKELIWEAVGEGTVDDDPKSQEQGIPEAVSKIMKEYPVPPVE